MDLKSLLIVAGIMAALSTEGKGIDASKEYCYNKEEICLGKTMFHNI